MIGYSAPSRAEMTTMLQLLSSIKTFNVNVCSGASFEDVLASPDKLLPELFNGSQVEAEMTMSGTGKKSLIDMWNKRAVDEGGYDTQPFLVCLSLLSAFAGFE